MTVDDVGFLQMLSVLLSAASAGALIITFGEGDAEMESSPCEEAFLLDSNFRMKFDSQSMDNRLI